MNSKLVLVGLDVRPNAVYMFGPSDTIPECCIVPVDDGKAAGEACRAKGNIMGGRRLCNLL